jgi:Zn-dependent peptidase ImmA (M78 family)
MKPVIKQLLREGLFTKDREAGMALIKDFVAFAKKHLGLDDGVVVLKFDRSELTTTAAYANKKVMVYVIDRAVVDIMRSIAHELVHQKQDADGRLTNLASDGKDGSPIENEANAMAGILIRKYGKLHPEIYI